MPTLLWSVCLRRTPTFSDEAKQPQGCFNWLGGEKSTNKCLWREQQKCAHMTDILVQTTSKMRLGRVSKSSPICFESDARLSGWSIRMFSWFSYWVRDMHMLMKLALFSYQPRPYFPAWIKEGAILFTRKETELLSLSWFGLDLTHWGFPYSFNWALDARNRVYFL